VSHGQTQRHREGRAAELGIAGKGHTTEQGIAGESRPDEPTVPLNRFTRPMALAVWILSRTTKPPNARTCREA
jgi:hypothetical protein